MFEKCLNKECVVAVYSASASYYAPQPKNYKGVIVNVQNNYIEMELPSKKKIFKRIFINSQFIISVEEV